MSQILALVSKIKFLQNPSIRAMMVHSSLFVIVIFMFGLILKKVDFVNPAWSFLSMLAFNFLIGLVHSWILNNELALSFSEQTGFNIALFILGFLVIFFSLVTTPYSVSINCWIALSILGFFYPFYSGEALRKKIFLDKPIKSCKVEELESVIDKDYFLASDHYIKWKIIHDNSDIHHVDVLPADPVGVSINPKIISNESLKDIFKAFLLFHNRKLILSHKLKSEIDTHYTWLKESNPDLEKEKSNNENEVPFTNNSEKSKKEVHPYLWSFYVDKTIWFGKKNLDPKKSIASNQLALKWAKERSLEGNEMTIKQMTIYAIRKPSIDHQKIIQNGRK